MSDLVGKRPICSACQYPAKQCICHLITPMDGRTQVWILQDKHEAKHAKNSARLFALNYTSTHIVPFTDDQALAHCLASCRPEETLLLFPEEEATPVERLSEDKKRCIKHVILLDGTWPKAKKMRLLEPRLNAYQSVSFASPPESVYEIRKSPNATALATLEAASYFLECVEDLQFSVIRHTFADIIALQWSQQPVAHKHKQD
ncbi:DTW domain-containing protein [Marinomonas ostreistagni]|uniref:DTW domain-containing protein n=1 Tax=Marinomonas ostreistagni TaxID=359209 RepID=UPI0019527922|nr:DTW domain-containing protein [Marinomonas ostreistagni]